MRPPLPPPPSGNFPAGESDVAAFLQDALIRPVDEARAFRDIALLAETAKAHANVTPLMSRRDRMFKQVAAAAAVVVVASGAGFGAAQLGGNTGNSDTQDLLAFETPTDTNVTDNATPPVSDTGTNDVADQPSPNVGTQQPATEPTPAPAPSPAPAPAPRIRSDAPVGDAGDAEAIDEFTRDDITADDTCEVDSPDTCDTDDEPVTDDGTDPRDSLRERRFGAN